MVRASCGAIRLPVSANDLRRRPIRRGAQTSERVPTRHAGGELEHSGPAPRHSGYRPSGDIHQSTHIPHAEAVRGARRQPGVGQREQRPARKTAQSKCASEYSEKCVFLHGCSSPVSEPAELAELQEPGRLLSEVEHSCQKRVASVFLAVDTLVMVAINDNCNKMLARLLV